MASNINTKISVVIATKNRTEKIHKIIDSIEMQTHTVDEIIIVDQSEKNFILSFEKKDLIKYYHCPHLSGLTAARNFGVNKCIGEIVFFLMMIWNCLKIL